MLHSSTRNDRRGLFSAAMLGAGFGLTLALTFLLAGLNGAVADHVHVVSVARQAGGALSESMLQRQVARLDPAALTLARSHDALAEEAVRREPILAWPGRFGARFPVGRRASAVDNARDLDCLTEAVYFEARGEPVRGQAAVAQVVLNRLASPHFPKTVCGVVFQGATRSTGCQFSFTCDGSMRRGLEMAAWDRSRLVAERALSGVSAAGLASATHFHTVDVQPYWGPSMQRVAQVGLHIFYSPNPHARAVEPELALAPRPAGRSEHAVLTSLPGAPVGELHLASAFVKAPEAEPAKAASAADTAAF